MMTGVKSPKLGRCSHSKEADKYKQYRTRQIKTEMSEPKAIQTIVNQVAIQAVTAVVIMLREADAGPRSGTNTTNLREINRQRHSRPALKTFM